MEQEIIPQQTYVETSSDTSTTPKRGSRGCLVALALIILGLVILWYLVRPGVFTIQPIGALPEGITLIYHSRNPEMPVFSSPDSLCLEMQGSVSLFCRAAALSAAGDLADRAIIRFPYSHWAYLRSTGGLEFDR
jgi:hypothetical protein